MHNKYYKIFLLTVFLLLPLKSLASEEYNWRFDREEDLKNWTGQGARFSYLKQSGLVRIEGGKLPVFISPPKLNIPINNAYFFKVRVRSSGSEMSKGFVFFKSKEKNSFPFNPNQSFDIKSDNKFNDYLVNLKDFLSGETILEQFSITFTGGSIIEISDIGVYKPSFIESSWYRLKKDFLNEQEVVSANINTIGTPMIGGFAFHAFLYGLSVVVFLFIIIFRRRFSINEIARAVTISLVFSGFVFAFKMDYGWLMMMKKDIEVFSGMDIRQRINTMFGDDLYDFAAIAKKIIPSDKKARKDISGEIGEGYFGIRLYRYYLLPIKTSKDGEYVLVYMDKSFVFDPATKTLTKDGRIIASPVEMIYNYNNYGFIYRIIK